MNRSADPASQGERRCRSVWAVPLAIVIAACSVPAEDSAAQTDAGPYDLVYSVTPRPAAGEVAVTMRVTQSVPMLREVRFSFDTSRFREFNGSGELQVDDGELRWYVPNGGGTLSWIANARRQRNDNGYDAWLDTDWGVLRAERIIPRAITRTRKGATSRTVLEVELPAGWSVVTQYAPVDERFPVNNPDRRFDEPSGWMVMGKLGVRLDRISGTRVVVAGPTDNNVRRLDILTFLNWTLPEVYRLVPQPAERLTIISAGDPMWRGGLSASQSLYLHADRPLVSENGTSTPLHEVLHVMFGLRAEPGSDWIVEGLAEYYTVEILSRSGGLSAERSRRSLASLAEWADSMEVLCEDPSTGSRTAYAATLFATLDAEIRAATGNSRNLDDVLGILLGQPGRVDAGDLIEAATGIIGARPDALQEDALPGCVPEAPKSSSE